MKKIKLGALFSLKRVLLSTLVTAFSVTGLFAQYMDFINVGTIGDTTIIYPTGNSGTLVVPPPVLGAQNARIASVSDFSIDYQGPWTNEAQIAFEYAMSIWENTVVSDVPIRVRAEYTDFTLDADLPNSALAGAYPLLATGNDGVFYPYALADKIFEADVDPANPDIVITINSASDWYYGTDQAVPQNRHDFVSVILHEIGHGLGFSSTASVQNGLHFYGRPDINGVNRHNIFDKYVRNTSGTKLTSFNMLLHTPAIQSFLTSNNLVWDGPKASGAKLYAPSPFQVGSSISHLDESTYTTDLEALMTPAIDDGESIHNPGGLAMKILEDIGWDINPVIGIEDEVEISAILYPSTGGYSDYNWGDLPSNPEYDLYISSQFFDHYTYGDYVVSRSFKCLALHDGGEYQVKSSSSSFMVLTETDFNLPNNYNWIRTIDGRVKVKIIVEVVDNDGEHHSDGYYVWVPTKPNTPSIEFIDDNNDDGTLSIAFNGAGANQYSIYYRPIGGALQSTNVTGGTHSYSFSSLNVSNPYEIYVVASNSTGTSTSGTIISNNSSVVSNFMLDFNRSEKDRVIVPHNSSYNLGTGDFTIEAWVNLSSTQNSVPTVFSNRSLWNDGIECFFYSGKMYIRLTTVNYSAPIAVNLYDNQCHHVAWVRNGTNVEFFVDGQSLGVRGVGTKNVNTGDDLYIGFDKENTGSSALNGAIKDVRLWNTARTSQEIGENKDGFISTNSITLIGNWKLNEGNGQVAYDASAIANNGRLGATNSVESNDPIWITACEQQPIAQNALDFDRLSNTRVSVSHVAEYDISTADFTVEAWVKLNATQKIFPVVISNRSDHSNGFKLFFYNGRMHARLTNTNYSSPVANNLYDGQCHHVALIRNGTTIEFVLDGVSQGTRNVGTKNLNTGHDLWIGHDFNSNYTPLDGSMKEVRFWNTARSLDQINNNLSLQLRGNEFGLLGYWKFNDGLGQIAADYSMLANNATLGSTSSTESIDPTWTTNTCSGSGAKEAGLEQVGDAELVVTAYPNPFSDGISMDLTRLEDEKVELVIYNANGIIVEEGIFQTNVIQLGSHWKPGLYVVNIISDLEVQSIKVIKN